MAFLFKLITVVTLAAVANSRRVDLDAIPSEAAATYVAPPPQLPAVPYQQPIFYASPSNQDSYALPLNFQLPNPESPKVPFYSPQPSGELRASQYSQNPEPSYAPQVSQYLPNQEQSNFDVPLPSQELKAPAETSWNPENDPKFYYEIPVILTKQQLPTNSYPKKYNKEIHSKSKPLSSRPKEEIAILPIDEKQYLAKQKSINKVFQNLAKKENRKQIEAEKVEKKAALFSSEPKQPELQGSASGFLEDIPHQLSDSSGDYSHGLSGKITAALGIPHKPEHGERVDFHVAGHDGPNSYKWGYDTGKGHDRQFRYEEKDKSGVVKGHYGYYDKHGELKMVHYDSHPVHGFHRSEGLPDHHH